LPDSVGKLGRALRVLDVLLDQLPAVGAERRIDKFDRSNAIQLYGLLFLPHTVERADHVLLPPDHVERRQLPQPRCSALGVLQGIGRVFGLRGQESEHRFHGYRLSASGRPIARAARAVHRRADLERRRASGGWLNGCL